MNQMTLNPLPMVTGNRSHLLELFERLTRSVRTLDTWRQRHIKRMQFADIDNRILRDVGISEAQRFIAVNKPFWEA